MSDLCMYELEDNVWDDFGATDDHIVPHAADNYEAQSKVQGDSRKKARHEVIGVTSGADNTDNKYDIFGEKEKGLHTLTMNSTFEKDSWSQIPDSLLPTSDDNDSHKEVTSMTSDDPRMSSHGLEAGKGDSVGSNNNDYRFPVNHITAADDVLSFFNNNHEDKENSDIYFGWGDLGNFEDVDRMFRSCDSTFGLGSLNNEDYMCWFSSSKVAEGSQDAFQADAKLNRIQEECPTSKPASASPSTSVNISGDNAGRARMSSLHVSNKGSESKDDSTTSNEQISRQERLSKQHRASGERRDRHLEYGGSLTQYGNINQFAEVKHPFTDSSCQLFSLSDLQQNKQKLQNIGPDSVNYVQTDIPYMHFSYSNSSDQVSISSTLSGAKSEKYGHSSSKNESSYASNQLQLIESSRGPSFEAPVIITNEKKGKLYCHQDTQTPLNRNVKHAKMERQMAFCNPVIIQMSEPDEGRSEVEGVSVGNLAELDSSNARESSCVISPWDEVSLEATSFRQLQQVMGKLDIRTKLCIRDSLYRLARSAEQRHCTTKGSIGDDKDVSGSSVTGFMDIETDTNPIDRSIAHLLFHRPSDPSQRPVIDTSSLKSHGMIYGSISNPPPMMSEKQVGDKETDAGLDKKKC